MADPRTVADTWEELFTALWPAIAAEWVRVASGLVTPAAGIFRALYVRVEVPLHGGRPATVAFLLIDIGAPYWGLAELRSELEEAVCSLVFAASGSFRLSFFDESRSKPRAQWTHLVAVTNGARAPEQFFPKWRAAPPPRPIHPRPPSPWGRRRPLRAQSIFELADKMCPTVRIMIVRALGEWGDRVSFDPATGDMRPARGRPAHGVSYPEYTPPPSSKRDRADAENETERYLYVALEWTAPGRWTRKTASSWIDIDAGPPPEPVVLQELRQVLGGLPLTFAGMVGVEVRLGNQVVAHWECPVHLGPSRKGRQPWTEPDRRTVVSPSVPPIPGAPTPPEPSDPPKDPMRPYRKNE